MDGTTLKQRLAARTPAVDFAGLSTRQQEMLLDFAWTEGAARVPAEFLETVLQGDWPRLGSEHRYIRYLGHAPDHARNKAFAARFGY